MWKDIKNYKGLYKISSIGQIYSCKKKYGHITRELGIKKTKINKSGYEVCNLLKDGKVKFYMVHRLVAIAFISNPLNKKQVNHKDGNKLNNNISNLEWVTCGENHYHAYKTGLRNSKGENCHHNKLKDKDVVSIRNSKLRNRDLAKKYNVSRSTITMVVKRKIWKHI